MLKVEKVKALAIDLKMSTMHVCVYMPNTGTQVMFNINSTTSMRWLIDAFCQREGYASHQLSFAVEKTTEVIRPDDTARSLNLANLDKIKVTFNQENLQDFHHQESFQDYFQDIYLEVEHLK